MPYDSNGNFSLTPGYLAVAGQVIQPSQHNPVLEDIGASGLSNVLVRDGRAPMTGALNMGGFKVTNLPAGTNPLDGANKTQLGILSAKATNYSAGISDFGAYLRFTATATLSLTAAATLGASWRIMVVADGGDVTVDPNASETINGLATLIVPNGSSAEIICDGSNFFTAVKPYPWGPAGSNSGVFSVAAQPSIIVTDIGAARFLRIKGRISQSASGIIVAQFSTNNGSSYDTGANYFSQSSFAQTSTNGASRLATTTGMVLSANGASDASSDLPFSIDIFDFNQAINCAGLVQSGPSIGSSRYVANLSVFHLTSTARNALRILNAGGGTISGTVVVEVVR